MPMLPHAEPRAVLVRKVFLPVMNDAIFKFKRYEDASLSYTGIDRHADETEVGGFDTEIRREEYEKIFYNKT